MVPTPRPVSAPSRVARYLAEAPDGPVRVLHHVPTALYVEVAGRCVGVVAPAAAQVPCALRVSDPVVLAPAALNPYVDRGTLYLTDDPLVVGRFVDVRVPRIDPDRVLSRAASPAPVPTAPPRTEPAGLAAYKNLPPIPDADTLARLVGHGDGLTPLGDDVLCGWLAVLHATGRLTEDVAALVREAAPRTTVLSATLLDCALHGEVLPEFAAYVAALGTPSEPGALRALTAVGHTSGAGLWFGATHALRTLTTEAAA
ncbi:MAG: DUF2877 domain-containing protein [Nocardioides sp.]